MPLRLHQHQFVEQSRLGASLLELPELPLPPAAVGTVSQALLPAAVGAVAAVAWIGKPDLELDYYYLILATTFRKKLHWNAIC